MHGPAAGSHGSALMSTTLTIGPLLMRLALVAGATMIAACGGGDTDVPAVPAATTAADPPLSDPSGPVLGLKTVARVPEATRLPGRYIVTLVEQDNASLKDIEGKAGRLVTRAGGGQVHERFSQAIQGFAASLSDAAVQALLEDPEVAAIEEDQVIRVGSVTQTPAPWGLDRIDQRTLPLTDTYRYAQTGAGVTVFIVDTGIRANHQEFRTTPGAGTPRVLPAAGYTVFLDGRGTGDCHGHGTLVAGAAGGLTFGTAKAVTLVPIRVLGCGGEGTGSGLIAGLDFIAGNPRRPSVVNLSLGAGASDAIDAAVRRLVDLGVPVVAAAGNSATDACGVSPARVDSALTVGASTPGDARAGFSNHGACVDVFAPGTDIASATPAGDDTTGSASGTSLAAPLVSGALALRLAAAPALTPLQLHSALLAEGTPGRLTGIGSGSPNLLAFTNPDAEPLPAGPIPLVSLGRVSARKERFPDNTWIATLRLEVRDDAGTPVPDATVIGGFTNGGATVSCTTAADGHCEVSTVPLHRVRVASVTWRIREIVAPGTLYARPGNSRNLMFVNRP
jgi:subtilisin family serine protease